MKIILAIVAAGATATAAFAGDQPVVYPTVYLGGPTYYAPVSSSVDSAVFKGNFSPAAGPSSANTAAAVTSGTSVRGGVGRLDYAPKNEDALYAQLLQEAQKRGLR